MDIGDKCLGKIKQGHAAKGISQDLSVPHPVGTLPPERCSQGIGNSGDPENQAGHQANTIRRYFQVFQIKAEEGGHDLDRNLDHDEQDKHSPEIGGLINIEEILP